MALSISDCFCPPPRRLLIANPAQQQAFWTWWFQLSSEEAHTKSMTVSKHYPTKCCKKNTLWFITTCKWRRLFDSRRLHQF